MPGEHIRDVVEKGVEMCQVEGGVIPSLKQESKYFQFSNKGELTEVEIHPEQLKIQQE